MDWGRFYFLGKTIYQPFQFYTGHLIPAVPVERVVDEVADGKPAYALVSDGGVAGLAGAGLRVTELARSPDCHITMIRWPMLDPRTRDRACPPAHLVRVER